MSNIGNKETMAANIKYYLDRTGKSQKDVADVVGVASSTFNEWIKAKKYPRIDKIEIMANYFGIQKSDLIEEKKEPTDTQADRLSAKKQQLHDLVNSLSEEDAGLLLAALKAKLQ